MTGIFAASVHVTNSQKATTKAQNADNISRQPNRALGSGASAKYPQEANAMPMPRKVSLFPRLFSRLVSPSCIISFARARAASRRRRRFCLPISVDFPSQNFPEHPVLGSSRGAKNIVSLAHDSIGQLYGGCDQRLCARRESNRSSAVQVPLRQEAWPRLRAHVCGARSFWHPNITFAYCSL